MIASEKPEGRANGNLGNAYFSLDYFRKAIEYHEKALKIAIEIEKRFKIVIEIGDRAGEGRTNGDLGNAGPEKYKPMKISVLLTFHWVTSEKSLNILKKA